MHWLSWEPLCEPNFLCISVLRVASGPRVKLASYKSALNPPVVSSTDRSKAVLVLLLVALWFILRGDLLYVISCVVLFLCFSAYSNIWREFRRGSETCKTPDWEKRLMKSSLMRTVKTWKKSLMHSRQYMVPRAQEPPHSLVQMELVFWLTKKLSWKDGMNTLMVSLIGHHLSMTKLSTYYHRWNVIRCFMSSRPSLKQWKQ